MSCHPWLIFTFSHFKDACLFGVSLAASYWLDYVVFKSEERKFHVLSHSDSAWQGTVPAHVSLFLYDFSNSAIETLLPIHYFEAFRHSLNVADPWLINVGTFIMVAFIDKTSVFWEAGTELHREFPDISFFFLVLTANHLHWCSSAVKVLC